MSAFSDSVEQAIINHYFKQTSLSANNATWISLHTADPTDAALSTEVQGTGYARISVTVSSTAGTGWTVTGSTVSNSAAIQFPASGTISNWTTHQSGALPFSITHFGI